MVMETSVYCWVAKVVNLTILVSKCATVIATYNRLINQKLFSELYCSNMGAYEISRLDILCINSNYALHSACIN